MRNAAASKAAWRWRLAAATSTMRSPGASAPTRWTMVTPDRGQRARACASISASAASVMPG